MNEPARRAAALCRWIAAGILALSFLLLLVGTLHWPLAGDASLMHYVAFLMVRAKTPYRDIVEMNMPGALMVDFLVIHTLGAGSMAWRAFDFALMGASILAMIEVARPRDWVAGLYAGVLLAAIHASDGIFDAGQRDFVVAVVILIGYAALFRALRGNTPAWMLLFGLAMGIAATIKPTFLLLGPALLVWVGFVRRSQGLRSLAWGVTGFFVPLLTTMALLMRWHALHVFLTGTRRIMVYHASLARRPIGWLLLHSVAPLWPLVGLGIFVVVFERRRRLTIEGAALGIGAVVSLFSYVVQAKGYPYQRYPLIALVLLAIGIALFRALRGKGVVRVLGYAGVGFGVLFLAPRAVWRADHYDWRNTEFLDLLESDLDRLGGPALSGHVQCIDTTGGCYNALYERQLIQSTGFLYDEFLFNDDRAGVVADNRKAFWNALQAHPPALVVVVDGLFPSEISGFDKLTRWPAFATYLEENYSVYAERRPEHWVYWWRRGDPPKSYRLYVRKAGPVLDGLERPASRDEDWLNSAAMAER